MFIYTHKESKSFYLTNHTNPRDVLLRVVKKPTMGSGPMRNIIFEHVRKNNILPYTAGYSNLPRPTTRHHGAGVTREVVAEWTATWDIETLDLVKENIETFIENKISEGWVCMNTRLHKIKFLELHNKYHGNQSADSSST